MATNQYPTHHAGDDGWSEWIDPIMTQPYRMACCDCNLVHEIEFRADPEDGNVNFRARRNNRSTAQLRRHRGVVLGYSGYQLKVLLPGRANPEPPPAPAQVDS